MPRFLGMSCFKIAHTPEAKKLFTCIGRKGKEEPPVHLRIEMKMPASSILSIQISYI